MEQKKNGSRKGGARPNSGRRPRDPKVWGQITCILRRETIEQLRQGCGGAQKHFGPFLQDHLDRHPLPSREMYQYWKKMKELQSKPKTTSQWDKEVRALRRAEREQRRAERERLRHEKWAKANPQAAKREIEIEKALLKVMKQEKKQARAAKAAKAAA